MSNSQPRKTTKKVLLSVAALAATAGIAGVGTYANFTGSTSASQTVSTGTMTLALGASGPSNRLSVNASGFAPSDSMQRAVNLSVSGTVGLASINLTTTDTTATPTILSTDATDGLQIKVDRCPVAWAETAVGSGFTYTCAAPVAVIARTSVVGAARAMNNMLVAAGDINYLRVTIDLPSTADDTFQNTVASPKSATISELFTGVQRAGISQ
jgi:hypothetical protein